jgi:hypothetical protein
MMADIQQFEVALLALFERLINQFFDCTPSQEANE